MDKENFFNNTHALSFPHDFPYEFASPYSTESDSEDEDVAGLTRRFSRSASLKEPLYNFKEKPVFSGSPESTLGWSGCISSQVLSPPPFVKGDEDALNLIYAAAGQVARMKMRMNIISNCGAGVVANKNNRGLLGAARAFDHPHCTPWGRTDGEEFFQQHQFCRNRGIFGNDNCTGGCGGRGAPPPSFPQSAWPPPQLKNQRLPQHRQNQHKPVVLGGSGGACDGGGGAMAPKRECVGTGVFLPRRYCNNPPESRKGQACSPPHLPARTVQSSDKTFASSTTLPRIQGRINGGFVPNYEMLMGRREAMILAAQQQRSNINGGVMLSPANNPEVLLPQEWTY